MSDTPPQPSEEAPLTPEQWGDRLIDEADEETALALEAQLIEQTDNTPKPEDPEQPEQPEEPTDGNA